MSSFPQREAVGRLADEEDEDAHLSEALPNVAEPSQDDAFHGQLTSPPVSRQPSAQEDAFRMPESYGSGLQVPIARASLEDDEMTALSSSVDPLGDVMDWLAFADLGEDDPELASRRGMTHRPYGESPGTPGASSSAAGLGKDAGSPGIPLFNRGQRKAAGYCGLGDLEQAPGPPVDPEDEEWEARQRQTGAAGRLVTYDFGDRPQEDFHLRGGGSRRLIVTSVRHHGKAEQAGIKSGDVLVSINGKKDFAGLSAEAVHRRIRAPAMLVFMGFVGKLQAEVRLNYKDRVCGLASQAQVAVGRPEAPLQVVDEVIFQPSSATLFLTVQAEPPKPVNRSWMNRLGLSTGDDGDVADVLLDDDDLQDLGVEFTGPILAAALEESNLVDKKAAGSSGGVQPATEAAGGEPKEGSHQEAEGDDGCLEEASQGGKSEEETGRGSEGPTSQSSKQDEPSLAAVYELRGQEARNLVSQALSRACSSSLLTSQPAIRPEAAEPSHPMMQVPGRPTAAKWASANAPQAGADGIPPIFAPMSRRLDNSEPPDLQNSKQFPTRLGGVVQDEWRGPEKPTRVHCDDGSWWDRLFQWPG